MKRAWWALLTAVLIAAILAIAEARRRPSLPASAVSIERLPSLPPLAEPEASGPPILPAPGLPEAEPEVRYLDPAERRDPKDVHEVSRGLVDALLRVLEATDQDEKPLVFTARALESEAGIAPERAAIVWEKLRTALLRSGKLRLASAGPVRAALEKQRRENEESGLYARPARPKKDPAAAPRYLLRGRLRSGPAAARPEDQTFTLALRLDTIETAETLWSGEAALLESLIR